uniref:Putative secreted protein n=1 Tax=Anopheles darlingi TaxID=43151 RepID=A0A2M4D5Z1_ANODA
MVAGAPAGLVVLVAEVIATVGSPLAPVSEPPTPPLPFFPFSVLAANVIGSAGESSIFSSAITPPRALAGL